MIQPLLHYFFMVVSKIVNNMSSSNILVILTPIVGLTINIVSIIIIIKLIFDSINQFYYYNWLELIKIN